MRQRPINSKLLFRPTNPGSVSTARTTSFKTRKAWAKRSRWGPRPTYPCMTTSMGRISLRNSPAKSSPNLRISISRKRERVRIINGPDRAHQVWVTKLPSFHLKSSKPKVPTTTMKTKLKICHLACASQRSRTSSSALATEAEVKSAFAPTKEV